MHPLTRQGLRLASSSKRILRDHVRNHTCQRKRHFSISSRRPFILPRKPSDTSEQGRNGTRQNEEHERTGDKQSVAKDTDDGEPVSAPPRLRRTLRQRRMGEYPREIPKPPPIPKWFLENNVRLSSTARQGRISIDAFLREKLPNLVTCKDRGTGRVLFTLPYTAMRLPDRFWYDVIAMIDEVKGNPGSKADTSPKVLDFLTRLAHIHLVEPSSHLHNLFPEDEAIREVFSPQISEETVHPQQAKNREEQLPKIKASQDSEEVAKSQDPSGDTQQGHNVEKLQEPERPAVQATEQGAKDIAEKPLFQPVLDWLLPNLRGNLSTMSWPFLEAQLSIEAGLALPTNYANMSLFAATRVDVSLVCSDAKCHENVDQLLRNLADAVGADTITLDANDFEDLTGEYVGRGRDGPNAFSTFGYEAFRDYVAPSADRDKPTAPAADDDDLDPDEEDEARARGLGQAHSLLDHINKIAGGARLAFAPAGSFRPQGFGLVGLDIGGSPVARRVQNAEIDDTDDRMTALFDSILNATRDMPRKEEIPSEAEAPIFDGASPEEKAWVDLIDRGPTAALTAQIPVASNLQRHARFSSLALIEHLVPQIQSGNLDMAVTRRTVRTGSTAPRTIVHVRDLKEIQSTYTGRGMIKHLLNVVQKRRQAGESIIVVATTVQDGFGPFEPTGVEDGVESQFRTVKVPASEGSLLWEDVQLHKDTPWTADLTSTPASKRILGLNSRHIQSMLRRLFPECELNLAGHAPLLQMCTPGSKTALSERVLSMDEVQRIVLLAFGLTQSLAESPTVEPVHIGLATMFTLRSDQLVQKWSQTARKKGNANANDTTAKNGQFGANAPNSPGQETKASYNAHETKLLTGLVNVKNIKVGFADVHATPDTIEALKTMTTLALARPDAFKYGVLAADRLPGVLLYGPPGTGKTLLAKAVAKESGATVLEVSGAQIYEKYVGEGEKMVRAVFSLAKKMSPCVVFMDEADALFCARQSAGGRNTHREIINQFLREWDGMDDHRVLVMVASNRPFDLDDAVLRRLPRRLLVDLPVTQDRESILGIHLKNERLSDEISLSKLAEQTPLYSGSDLKNLCVAAALACVREENDLAARKKQAGEEFQLPERRTLHLRHFERAITEISASINEDMSTLAAIRKFDEQYGDRRGRKKKSAYGFGNVDHLKHDESAARVRQGPVSPSDSSPTAPPPA